VGVADSRGQTPLHVAAAAGRNGVAALLLEFGANPGAPDEYGLTPEALLATHGLDIKAQPRERQPNS
jgi:ankyrin repeat protein